MEFSIEELFELTEPLNPLLIDGFNHSIASLYSISEEKREAIASFLIHQSYNDVNELFTLLIYCPHAIPFINPEIMQKIILSFSFEINYLQAIYSVFYFSQFLSEDVVQIICSSNILEKLYQFTISEKQTNFWILSILDIALFRLGEQVNIDINKIFQILKNMRDYDDMCVLSFISTVLSFQILNIIIKKNYQDIIITLIHIIFNIVTNNDEVLLLTKYYNILSILCNRFILQVNECNFIFERLFDFDINNEIINKDILVFIYSYLENNQDNTNFPIHILFNKYTQITGDGWKFLIKIIDLLMDTHSNFIIEWLIEAQNEFIEKTTICKKQLLKIYYSITTYLIDYSFSSISLIFSSQIILLISNLTHLENSITNFYICSIFQFLKINHFEIENIIEDDLFDNLESFLNNQIDLPDDIHLVIENFLKLHFEKE